MPEISQFLHVVAVDYRGDHRLWLQFSDGVAGEADLSDSLEGPVFEPLRHADQFAAARLDAESHTVVWETGADFAPEYLRGLVLTQTAASGA